MPITDPSEQYFKDGTWGWDGTRWRKLPLTWGYTDVYIENVRTNDAVAGLNDLDGSLVPAGEVWVVTNVVLFNTDSATTIIDMQVWLSPDAVLVRRVRDAIANYSAEWAGQVYLKAGYRMRAEFSGCTLNDNLRANFLGYKMAVT